MAEAGGTAAEGLNPQVCSFPRPEGHPCRRPLGPSLLRCYLRAAALRQVSALRFSPSHPSALKFQVAQSFEPWSTSVQSKSAAVVSSSKKRRGAAHFATKQLVKSQDLTSSGHGPRARRLCDHRSCPEGVTMAGALWAAEDHNKAVCGGGAPSPRLRRASRAFSTQIHEGAGLWRIRLEAVLRAKRGQRAYV